VGEGGPCALGPKRSFELLVRSRDAPAVSDPPKKRIDPEASDDASERP
jgi:hypothetical protein